MIPLAAEAAARNPFLDLDSDKETSVRHRMKGKISKLKGARRLYKLAKDDIKNPPVVQSPVKKKHGPPKAPLGIPKPRRRRDPLPGQIVVSVVQKKSIEEFSNDAPGVSLHVSGSKDFEPIHIKAWPSMTTKELKKKILARIPPSVTGTGEAMAAFQLKSLRLACCGGVLGEEQTLSDWDVRQDEFIFCFVTCPSAEAELPA